MLTCQHKSRRNSLSPCELVVDGYWGGEGLSISAIDLTGKPRVADVEYLERGLDIRPVGYLAPGDDPVDADYECEVSCVDWYGNARPIFTDGRIFALTGTELIEGYFAGGSILERQRVNLTAMPLHRR